MTWFSKRKHGHQESIDFSSLKTDLHSHLIPEIDDGAKNLDNSLELIRSLYNLGFSKLITTPHIMSDYYKNDITTIKNGLHDVKKAVKEAKINVSLEAAAEYYVDFEFQKAIPKKEFLFFGDKYILIELSFIAEPQELDITIFDLQVKGYNVVLAHPERYAYYGLKDYQRYLDKGVFLQLNLLSLIGYYSEEVKKKAELLVDKNLVAFVGTDCHNINHVSLLKECFTNQYWHKLLDSGKLLNSSL